MGVQKSKKQQRRIQNNSRPLTIGIIVMSAILIAIALIYSTSKPASGVVVPQQISHPKADGLTLGDINAPAKIEVFEDFQCPACKQFTEHIEPLVLSELVETDRAYYVFHNYPFLDRNSETKESRDAANASLCANEEGKFWEYHDTLFANWNGENEGNLVPSRLIEFASTIDMDVEKFTTCVNEARYANDVQASFDLGNSMGVSGTPSVFVNGQQISPGYIPTFEDIKTAVEAVQK